ncbi:Pleckstrin domain-containing family G member 2 [Oopsacas minuta]|uniref:Pleckstrin domain-containing family G member 2 n=1 Tax=Oopsacas minuta TaxID=111878 RepID=A0AAV7JFH4_9METZ|nr:Pleckstrin domain-containing family G member 2 [Oopsacas minuta]
MSTEVSRSNGSKRSLQRILSFPKNVETSTKSATNSHFYKDISPPPSPTTGERKQYNAPTHSEQLDIAPMEQIDRPASANSHHYINHNSPGSPLKRVGSCSTEDILISGSAVDVNRVDSFAISSLPVHSHSELHLSSYNQKTWNNPFYELINTEERYVQDLKEIVTGYLTVLENAVNSDPNFNLNLNVLFSNIRTLYDFHIEFLDDIRQVEMLRNVAECFLQRKQQFINEYTIYCNNYPNACEILKDINFNHDLKIISNFKICQQSLGHMLPLSAYLLKPVQRVLKYPLLLKAMLKDAFTVNYSHFAVNGYQEMKTALDCMSEVSEEINLMKRKHELTLRVNEIQSMLVGWNGQDLNSFGQLLLEDQLKIKGYRKERNVFLFEKLFLVTKMEDEQYTQPMYIPVNNLMLLEAPKEGNSYLRVYEQKNASNYFLIEFSNANVRKEWANTIKDLIVSSSSGLPENHRKRILEACQSINQDVLCQTEHIPHNNKFRDLASIKKRFRYRAKPKRQQQSTPIADNAPRMRHSATFSPNSISPRNTHRHKRLSDATNYDTQYLENEIRISDNSLEVSNISIAASDTSLITIPCDESFPVLSDSLESGENSRIIDEPASMENSTSNCSLTGEQNGLFNKSPSRKGAIRRKSNTYLNKKLSATFSATSTEDEFGICQGEAKLRRRHTDKEIHPDILDALNQLDEFKPLQSEMNDTHPAKSEESDSSDGSKIGFNSPEYFKQRIHNLRDDGERKRSRIMDFEEGQTQYDTALDFTSPDPSFTSAQNQPMPSPKYKNTPSVNRNKMTRRGQISRSTSNAKKRLFLEDKQFNPDPSSLNTTPQVQLKHYFGKEIGELSFTSTQSSDDYYIGRERDYITNAKKFNTVRQKKSSLNSLFGDPDDSKVIRRILSLPQPCRLSNLFDSPIRNTDKDIENSNYDSSAELEVNVLENSVKNEPIIPLLNTNKKLPKAAPESSELPKTRVLLDGPPSDSSDNDSIHSIPTENMPETVTTPEEFIQASILDDYVQTLKKENYEQSLKTEQFTEVLKQDDFLQTLKPENFSPSPKAENIKEDSAQISKSEKFSQTSTPVKTTSNYEISNDLSTSQLDEYPSKPIIRHTNQPKLSPSHQNEPQVQSSNYRTEVLQFVFVGSISIIIAINFLYEVFCSVK